MADTSTVRKLKVSSSNVGKDESMGDSPQSIPEDSETLIKGKFPCLCPICGKEMEKGFVGMEKIFSDVQWFKEKTRFGTGGTSLHIKDWLGMAYIEACRCESCKVFIAKY